MGSTATHTLDQRGPTPDPSAVGLNETLELTVLDAVSSCAVCSAGNGRGVALILFVAELGSGFGHVHRLLPIARAARTLGHDALFMVSNRDEVAACVTSAGFRIVKAPAVPRKPLGLPAPGAVATSFADIFGGSGFADAEFLLAICARWDAELAKLRPVAIVCES